LVAGIAVRRSGRVPDGSHQVLNVWVLDVALPALVLRAMHDLVFPADVALVVAAPYVLFTVSTTIFLAAGRLLRLGREVTGALIATAALANTSFVGIPMLTAFFGEADIPVALLVDQLGSFLLLMTVISLTVVIAARSAPVPGPVPGPVPTSAGVGSVDPPAAVPGFQLGRTARSILLAPAMIALLAGLASRPVELPADLDAALATLGATLTPVALFAVGLQLHVDALRAWWRHVMLGLAVKLVVAPAAVAGIYFGVGAFGSRAVDVALFEIAMPPMVAGSIMATRAGLAAPLPSLLVGVGVPASLLTLPVWSWLLQR
jgi:hypothetical protein